MCCLSLCLCLCLALGLFSLCIGVSVSQSLSLSLSPLLLGDSLFEQSHEGHKVLIMLQIKKTLMEFGFFAIKKVLLCTTHSSSKEPNYLMMLTPTNNCKLYAVLLSELMNVALAKKNPSQELSCSC